MRLHFTPVDLDRLMNVYQMKGRISATIYEDYLRPYVIGKMDNVN